ncbi:unnamed protein product [Acanthoscelides obtectus]|uniref:Uncharacterized protein n=1 Tax=Acanthoscelides obtectus TaxID=200917 RepID=A0A9P0L0Q7_ACAOB|nr:unnamed protein product [Acanthoscelides obtectus]CAK1661140.1 hypothetical protein AOBTE_LOCUS22468 [Acanthoscelides obtectus]
MIRRLGNRFVSPNVNSEKSAVWTTNFCNSATTNVSANGSSSNSANNVDCGSWHRRLLRHLAAGGSRRLAIRRMEMRLQRRRRRRGDLVLDHPAIEVISTSRGSIYSNKAAKFIKELKANILRNMRHLTPHG